jgi:hypothetical protein
MAAYNRHARDIIEYHWENFSRKRNNTSLFHVLACRLKLDELGLHINIRQIENNKVRRR